MKEPITATITSEDYNKAVELLDDHVSTPVTLNCPLALAVQRATGNNTIGTGYDSFRFNGVDYICKQPACDTFTRGFDNLLYRHFPEPEVAKFLAKVQLPLTLTFEVDHEEITKQV